MAADDQEEEIVGGDDGAEDDEDDGEGKQHTAAGDFVADTARQKGTAQMPEFAHG